MNKISSMIVQRQKEIELRTLKDRKFMLVSPSPKVVIKKELLTLKHLHKDLNPSSATFSQTAFTPSLVSI
jgi:hypothetical protein